MVFERRRGEIRQETGTATRSRSDRLEHGRVRSCIWDFLRSADPLVLTYHENILPAGSEVPLVLSLRCSRIRYMYLPKYEDLIEI